MASLIAPTDRALLIAKFDETICFRGKRHEIGTNDYGDAVAPSGFRYMRSFDLDVLPEWIFEIEGIVLRKSLGMVQGENTSLLRYELIEGDGPICLEFLPLLATRSYHALQTRDDGFSGFNSFQEGLLRCQKNETSPPIFMLVPGASFEQHDDWYHHLNYSQESERGFDHLEDLYNPGVLRATLVKGNSLIVALSDQDPAGKDLLARFETEKIRKQLLAPEYGFEARLARASDQFIVSGGSKCRNSCDSAAGSANSLTVIAGYPWFTDWSRDTMISLPGLCLAGGRFGEARAILVRFAAAVSEGMLPNRFVDHQTAPEFNQVDGTLWFFNAAYCYGIASGDWSFLTKNLLPVFSEIIDWHLRGTRFGIKADGDGLLMAGVPGVQLTWMDARVGDCVVTPRVGKAVEVQALWYNALCILAHLWTQKGNSTEAEQFESLALKARRSFHEKFWVSSLGHLLDCIGPDGEMDGSVRPNQILATSLPFPLVEGDRAARIFRIVQEKLLTPVGLRTLAPSDLRYQGVYAGDARARDGAYHQGTVWPWLLGPFIDAGMRIFGMDFKQNAERLLAEFPGLLKSCCVGTLPEIYDGDAPHRPRGCVAQAWSVAEIRRVMWAHSLVVNQAPG